VTGGCPPPAPSSLTSRSRDRSAWVSGIAARDEFWPHYAEVMGRVAAERGFPPPTRESFAREIGPGGALYVGAPETVAATIVATLDTLGATRFDLKYGMGDLPHDSLMRAIELYGAQVVPLVREMVGRQGGTRAAAR